MRRPRAQGQSTVEFALLVPLFLLLVWGLANAGVLLLNNISLLNASRASARYASINTEAWSDASSPATNTIEGEAIRNSGITGLKNDDTDIQISYWDMSTSPPTECGYYSASGNSFVAETGYTESACIKQGNEVTTSLHVSFNALTGPLNGTPLANLITITDSATFLIEVTP